MDKKLWYKMLGKEDAYNRSLYYKINEALEDTAKYKLDLDGGKIFLFGKSKNVLIGNPDKDYITLTKDELKKIFNFAKKNGAI